MCALASVEYLISHLEKVIQNAEDERSQIRREIATTFKSIKERNKYIVKEYCLQGRKQKSIALDFGLASVSGILYQFCFDALKQHDIHNRQIKLAKCDRRELMRAILKSANTKQIKAILK